jgi:D-3-phosphoglycerate dehydrogenase
MDPLVKPLVVDLLTSLRDGGKSYNEVMQAWRTSCPRLPVWEEANAQGFVQRRFVSGQSATVELTERGRDFLAEQDGPPAAHH